jgi:quinol monooxygenase YgiN
MATQDSSVSIHPYFKVADGKMDAFKQLCARFVDTTATEATCHYYGFSFNGDEVHCREAYVGAEGLLAHLENVGALLQEALTMAEVARLEVHGTEVELAKLRGPLADFNPTYFVLECGFRR